MKRRGEVRVHVRSGSAPRHDRAGFKRVLVVVVGGGPKRPLLWLGAGEREGVAWVAGAKTLRAIRDAITAVLEDSVDKS